MCVCETEREIELGEALCAMLERKIYLYGAGAAPAHM